MLVDCCCTSTVVVYVCVWIQRVCEFSVSVNWVCVWEFSVSMWIECVCVSLVCLCEFSVCVCEFSVCVCVCDLELTRVWQPTPQCDQVLLASPQVTGKTRAFPDSKDSKHHCSVSHQTRERWMTKYMIMAHENFTQNLACSQHQIIIHGAYM